MRKEEEVTPSGLIVVSEDEKAAKEEIEALYSQAVDLKPKKKRNLRWRGVHHHDVLNIDLRTEAKMETTHKLSPAQRKARRQDNKAMAEIRKKRKRKKHGRR